MSETEAIGEIFRLLPYALFVFGWCYLGCFLIGDFISEIKYESKSHVAINNPDSEYWKHKLSSNE
jgi:hypothetical protein